MVLRGLHSYMKKNETRSPSYNILKNISKWIKDLNINRDTIKVLEGNKGRTTSDFPCSNIFTDMSPKARDIKERINKWDLIKIKSSAWLKQTSTKWKVKQPYWKIYLQMIPQRRVSSPKYIKSSHDSTPGRQPN